MVSTPDSGSEGHEFESQWDHPLAVQCLPVIQSCQISDAQQGQPWLPQAPAAGCCQRLDIWSDTKPAHNIPGEACPVQGRGGTIPSLAQLAMLCLMPSRTQLALLAARALLTHIQLPIDQDPQVPCHGTAFQHLIPQCVHTSGVAPFQV
ncbi:hypothetical protein WISP_127593 [Willisornis vidua]|uniref:Uncharacterized protein n=1 Tax=Willisornis vidua TaxID=1566151 RepID=A0ABQ9CW30_9PASS|nr:hypothetical protein WISP_127593 [Willisornis vidua]